MNAIKGFCNIVVGSLILISLSTCKKTQSTCTDNKQNGTETGVDCGGDCPMSCEPILPPGPITAPCVSTASTNIMLANSTSYSLPYVTCGYSSPYYSILRSSSSSGVNATNYVYIHFYGYPATVAKTYTCTGDVNYPTNSNQVRLRMKVNSVWYYPTGTVYYDPGSGNYTVYVCSLYASPFTFITKITCS
jgi:hypothetical protein